MRAKDWKKSSIVPGSKVRHYSEVWTVTAVYDKEKRVDMELGRRSLFNVLYTEIEPITGHKPKGETT